MLPLPYLMAAMLAAIIAIAAHCSPPSLASSPAEFSSSFLNPGSRRSNRGDGLLSSIRFLSWLPQAALWTGWPFLSSPLDGVFQRQIVPQPSYG